jgi:ribonucleoside-diphosphate reductase alpha chain
VRKYPCSLSDVPGLYEAFGLPEFNDLYLKYENNKNISRKVVNGKDILLSLSLRDEHW